MSLPTSWREGSDAPGVLIRGWVLRAGGGGCYAGSSQCSIPLKNARGANTCFFAFADTVVARAYGRNNECHGWLGVKWQTKPGAAPSRLMVRPSKPATTALGGLADGTGAHCGWSVVNTQKSTAA